MNLQPFAKVDRVTHIAPLPLHCIAFAAAHNDLVATRDVFSLREESRLAGC
jgi:hypothetical protein